MRIAIFHNRYRERGGEDTAVDTEAELLAKGGHDVVRCIVDNREALASPADALRVALSARRNPESAARAAALADAAPLDVAHVHNFFPVLTPAVHEALAARGVPVVQTLHNYRLVCANGNLLREGRVCEECIPRGPCHAVRHGCYRGSRVQTLVWADATAHHRARDTWRRCVDRFVVPSAFAANKLVAAGLPRERVEVLPNVLADPGEPAPPGRGAVFVGRLAPEKGVDLLIGVRRRHLYPEADLVAGHQRVRRHRHIDPAVEQLPAHLVDVVRVGERDLDDRIAGAVRGGDPERTERGQDPRRHAMDVSSELIAADGVHPQAFLHRGQRGHRRRARVQVRRRRGLEDALELARAGDERQQ